MTLMQAINGLAAEPSSSKKDITFESRDGAVVFACGGQPVGEYVYRDEKVLRPYFARLRAPGGLQVTRNQPPIPDQDATDHEFLHPGDWLALADVSGQDSRCNLAPIRHERFTEPPAVRHGRLGFATESRMLTTNRQPLCTLLSRVTLMPDPANSRPSWFHNRDYGLMVANTFGQNSMKQGEVSRVEVKQGEKWRLRFGLLLHAAAPDQEVDLAPADRDFLEQLP